MSALLCVRDLSYSFPGKDSPLFSGVNLTVGAGEVVGIVGLSGSGKTTLCHCLSGIIPLIRTGDMQGVVRVMDRSTRDLTPARIATRLGIVFQNPDTQLFFPRVEDEVAFGPENLCLAPEEIDRRITAALKTVGMEGFRHRNPHRLSGGEKQMIALASVLSLDPRVLIFDEALSQLDAAGRKRILDLIGDLKRDGRAIVMVEHNPDNLVVAGQMMLLHEGTMSKFDGQWQRFAAL